MSASLISDARGGLLAVEYLILFALVGVPVALVILYLGWPMLHQYRFMQYVLTAPVV